MKKIFLISIAIVVIAAVSIIGCNKDDITTITAVSNTTGRGIADQVNAFAKEPLSNDELTSIQWMREEEKLAHDVYVTLYNKWRMNVFTNIAESEQTHENAVAALMAKYGIPDNTPAAVGVFTNPDLQELYNKLVAQGNTSLMEAFKVGATIEDLDIYDLNQWLQKVDNRDVVFVYQNLTKGSRNHLRSFYSQIVSAGGTYTAQYITQAELEAIVNSPRETGAW